jgi:hypothetical protein
MNNNMNTSVKLHQETLDDLESELDLILEHLDSDDLETIALASSIFEQDLLPRLEKKIDGYVSAINRKKASSDYRKGEAKRINALAKADDNTITWLRERLQSFMEQRVIQLGEKGKTLEGKLCQVSLVNNGGKPPIWINEELPVSEFPGEYVVQIPTLDREKLLEAVTNSANGELLDDRGNLLAKVLPRGQHLRIK